MIGTHLEFWLLCRVHIFAEESLLRFGDRGKAPLTAAVTMVQQAADATLSVNAGSLLSTKLLLLGAVLRSWIAMENITALPHLSGQEIWLKGSVSKGSQRTSISISLICLFLDLLQGDLCNDELRQVLTAGQKVGCDSTSSPTPLDLLHTLHKRGISLSSLMPRCWTLELLIASFHFNFGLNRVTSLLLSKEQSQYRLGLIKYPCKAHFMIISEPCCLLLIYSLHSWNFRKNCNKRSVFLSFSLNFVSFCSGRTMSWNIVNGYHVTCILKNLGFFFLLHQLVQHLDLSVSVAFTVQLWHSFSVTDNVAFLVLSQTIKGVTLFQHYVIQLFVILCSESCHFFCGCSQIKQSFSPVAPCPAKAAVGTVNDVAQTKRLPLWSKSWGILRHKCETYFVLHP